MMLTFAHFAVKEKYKIVEKYAFGREAQKKKNDFIKVELRTYSTFA
jgi:hypothetical protein